MTILDKLKAELKKKGLPESLAGILNITEESGIEGAINELFNLVPQSVDDLVARPQFAHLKGQIENAKQVQSEADKKIAAALATHEATLRTKFNFVEKAAPAPTPAPAGNEWQATMDKKIAEQQAIIDGFVKSQSRERLNSILASKLVEKKIPAHFLKGNEVESEDQVETVLASITKTYDEVRQNIINEQFGGNPPKVPAGDPTGTEISDYAKSKNDGSANVDGIQGKKF
jgi:hypothetical protein